MTTLSPTSALLFALVAAPQAAAVQDSHSLDAPRFAAPLHLMAGGDALGGGLPYPSPRLYDIDGDGAAELVVADLRGRVHLAEKGAGDGPGQWSELQPFMSGERALKFHNW